MKVGKKCVYAFTGDVCVLYLWVYSSLFSQFRNTVNHKRAGEQNTFKKSPECSFNPPCRHWRSRWLKFPDLHIKIFDWELYDDTIRNYSGQENTGILEQLPLLCPWKWLGWHALSSCRKYQPLPACHQEFWLSSSLCLAQYRHCLSQGFGLELLLNPVQFRGQQVSHSS